MPPCPARALRFPPPPQVYDTYTGTNLRYSQTAPLDMYKEVNTKTNLPAQIDLYAAAGNEYHFQFIAKGGGSANKTFLYQQTKSLLNPKTLMKFLEDNIKTLGTAACPPYHLAVVIGGLSAGACPWRSAADAGLTGRAGRCVPWARGAPS